MRTTPLDIQQQQFRIKFRGFDIEEVEVFLEQMADAFESLQQENDRLREEISRLKDELREYKNREETLKLAMLNSQKGIEQMKEGARKSAELIIKDAEVQAEKMLNKAHGRLAQLFEDRIELKRQRMQIEVQIRSLLESHTKLLDIRKEEMETMDEEEDKLKFLKQSR